jgi:hypothetical protein
MNNYVSSFLGMTSEVKTPHNFSHAKVHYCIPCILLCGIAARWGNGKCTIWQEVFNGNRALGRLESRWKDNIEIILLERVCEGID